DESDFKTYITVDKPVQVPGALLEPNVKYTFTRLGVESGRNLIVRVENADQTKVISSFMAISDERLQPADGTILTFYETEAGYAKPVRSWFYPGRQIGLQFIYPKAKMTEITAHLIGTHPGEVQTAQVQTQSVVTEPEQEQTQAPPENALA